MITKPRVKEFLVALSLANLCFIRVWALLLATQNDYYRDAPASGLWALTAVLGVVVLAVLFLGAKTVLARGERHSASRIALHVGFIGALAVALNGIRQQLQYSILEGGWFGGRSPLAAVAMPAVGISVLVVLAAFSIRRDGVSGFVQAWTGVILAMFPFFIVTTTRSVQVALSNELPTRFVDRPLSSLRDEAPAPYRVVVLVFDGLDFDMPAGTREFDRLLSTSITWQNAYPRTNRTIDSLPAIITGRPITAARAMGASELLLSSEDSPSDYEFAGTETLFTKVHKMGVRSALVGWYHPYCRMLMDLSTCHWYPYEPSALNETDVVRGQVALLADTIPFAFRVGVAKRARQTRFEEGALEKWHANLYEKIQADADAAAADPSIGLVFVHYPVPHLPFISTLIANAGKTNDYDGNVALADRALGSLRQAIDAAGLTDRTAIVVTADHWNRGPEEGGISIRPRLGELNHRVHLILHFPGQTKGAPIDSPIENVAAHYIALSLFDAQLRSAENLPAAMANWPSWIKSSLAAE